MSPLEHSMNNTAINCELPPLAEWADEATVKRQSLIFSSGTMREVLDLVDVPLLIINTNRQTVFLNKRLRRLLGDKPIETMLGRRPGDLFNCARAFETSGGCGTSESCAFCGARASALAGLAGREASQESRILGRDPDSGRTVAHDIHVSSKPLDRNGERFAIITFQDISEQKRRRALERIFFHDMLNTAGNLIGIVDLMTARDRGELHDELEMFNLAAMQIIDEIRAQKLLMDAESRELVIRPECLYSRQFLDSVLHLYSVLNVARNRRIEIDPKAEEVCLESDATLLRRVLGNMIKNALEAVREGDTVTISCRADGDSPLFSVHNPGQIDKKARTQIFMRHFSTKGNDRGLGTYSIKLLGEDYLGGKVWFESSQDRGTTFYLKLPPTIPIKN